MRPVIISLAAALAACASSTTVPAVFPSHRLQPESRAECEGHCGQLGMRLGAVVIIHSSIGCVCEPTQATMVPAPVSGTGVASGAAVHAMLAAAEQQRRQQLGALLSKPMSTTPGVPTPGAHGLLP